MNYQPATYIDSDSDEDEYNNEDGPIGGAIGGFKTTIGPNINNSNNDNRKVVTLGPYDPKSRHRVVHQGMHFQGRCLNGGCDVNGEMVWVPLGYGSIIFAEKVYECPCPICKVVLQAQTITNIGYRYAKVKFVGRKSNGEKVEFSDEEKEGKFVKFLGGKDGKSAEWVSLRMEVEKL